MALSLESGIERLDERIQLSSCNSNAGDKDNCKSVIEKQTATIQESIKLRPIALRIVLAGRIAAVLLFLSFYVGLFFWRPFIIMRRRFAFEIERFTLRIQGLASKPELAELAVAEAHVTNENTLRAFVEITRKVAIRHGIPQLVTTFDLWRENQKDSSSLKD